MVTDDKADAINALIDAVESIEHELGITPSGVYSDVRVRLDILEARINNPLAPAPNVENPFFIGNDGVSISTGTGYPTESRLSGSLYLRKDGYNNEGLYATRPDGYWHLIDTDPWTAAGDLAGNIYSQTVIGFQNRPFSANSPIDTLAGDGYVIGWNSFASQWEPQIGFYPSGDLTGNKVNQTIVNIQGTPIVIGTLNSNKDGYALIWNNIIPQWEPRRLAVVFDPLNSSSTTNLKSNRYLTQSPIDNTKIGIINLSSDTTQSTAGVSSNYGVILGGDQNEVDGDYGLIGGGFQNTNVGSFSFIGNGANNILSGNNAVIGGGTSNNTDSDYSFIGGGTFHNLGSSSFSTILGGNTNSISFTDYAVILSGNGNQIAGVALSFASILNGVHNIINGTSDGYLTILNGISNTIAGFYNVIGSGTNNTLSDVSHHSSILNGNSNNIDGYYNTILSGSNNSISNKVSYNLIFGKNNASSSNYSLVTGLANIINVGSDFTTIYGDNNIINAGSNYANVFGSFNGINDGYVNVFGDHNSMNIGSTYANVHGNNNIIGNSKYVNMYGSSNIVGDSSTYAFIFGNSNIISTGCNNSGTIGTSNTLFAGSSYSYLNGSGNRTTAVATYSRASGKNHVISSSYSTVYGKDGYSIFDNQFIHSASAIDGATAGSSQYSRVILSGSQGSGGQFDLQIPTTLTNLSLTDGKSYDMSIRILVNNTSGAPTCARYVHDVLAHCESGALTIDIDNNTLLNDNSTGWTVSLLTSGNQLIVRVNSSGVLNRRAVATVEWRELSRL